MQVAQQGPDVGLYEQPNMTFTVPSGATPGVHDVYIELRRTRDQLVIFKVHTKFTVKSIETIEDALRALYYIILQLADIMPEGNAASISAKLIAAMDAIETGNFAVAINQIAAAIKELDALSGKTIQQAPINKSAIDVKKRLLGMVSTFLQEKPPPKEPLKICVCIWGYTITTKYIGFPVEDKTSAGYLKIHGKGPSVWAVGVLDVWGFFQKGYLSGAFGTATYVRVFLKKKCKGCKPEIFLSSSGEGFIRSHFQDDALGTGSGRAVSAGRSLARHNLNYVDEKAVRSGEVEVGLRLVFRGFGITVDKGEGRVDDHLNGSDAKTVEADSAEVYLAPFYTGEMLAKSNLGGSAWSM